MNYFSPRSGLQIRHTGFYICSEIQELCLPSMFKIMKDIFYHRGILFCSVNDDVFCHFRLNWRNMNPVGQIIFNLINGSFYPMYLFLILIRYDSFFTSTHNSLHLLRYRNPVNQFWLLIRTQYESVFSMHIYLICWSCTRTCRNNTHIFCNNYLRTPCILYNTIISI